MNRLLSRLTVACFTVAIVATPAFAAKKEKAQRDPTAGLQKKLQKADLPTDARQKAEKILKEYGPKIREAQSAAESVLTAEQKSARAAAQKSAKKVGKKRKVAAAEIAAALKLTDEQRTKYQAAQKDLQAAQKDMSTALRAALTSEQLAKVGIKTRKKKNA
jgi:hypothetical protein